MSSARNAALRALIQFRRDGSWTDLLLKKELAEMSREDAALASAITYGVLQNMQLLDFYISQYSSIRIKKIMPQVLDAMRCGVYQIVFMDRVPMFAAVNETVALIKKQTNPRAASFANAVLRKICAEKNNLPIPDRDDSIRYLSTIYSHPEWLVEKFISQYGIDESEKLLKANNASAPLYIRVNTLKTTTDNLIEVLTKHGVVVDRVFELSDALLCRSGEPLHLTDEFKDGLFYIQDIASQMAVSLLDAKPGETIIDMCAAPGGKSLVAAQNMANKGRILSFDLHPHKAQIIADNAIKYGATIIEASASDSSVTDGKLAGMADRIICDVPCSGLGIIRKKPDIRYKSEESIKSLPDVQYRILKNAAKYLKSGGRLVYSTCTILKDENEDIINRFLSEEKDFKLVPFYNSICGSCDGTITLLPHINNCDGFFIAVLDRK